ncbi:MAG: DUF2993 domain-containing protein [Actinomycetota bacterium]
MTQENAGLGEQAISKVAEMALNSQLDESETLSVSVKTDPGKLAQGEVESVAIDGKGLVMQQDLRMAELEMQLKNVAVNPLSAIFGKLELTQPAHGAARVVLTEADLNRAFNSEYINSKLSGLKVHADGKTVTIDVQTMECHLLASGKIALDATVLVRETGSTEAIAFTTKPEINRDGSGVSLQEVNYPSEQEFSPELTTALVEKAGEILNLRSFDLQGMSLRIQRLDVKPGELVLEAKATVEELPV